VNTSLSLRIATRIHFALLRRYGANVEVGTLLKGGADAREAMWVCEASGDAELVALARQLKDLQGSAAPAAAVGKAAAATSPKSTDTAADRPASKPASRQAGKHAAPQDAVWSRDTSGFGVSRPAELALPPIAEAGSRWLRPSSWGRRSATPPSRH